MQSRHHVRWVAAQRILCAIGSWYLFFACPFGFDVFAAEYRVRHHYNVQLADNEELRGQWRWRTKTAARGRPFGVDREKNNGRTAVFLAPYDDVQTAVAISDGSRGIASAEVDVDRDGGFHQVDGSAVVGGDGFALARSESVLALNTGTRNARGTIRWNPDWVVDRISKGVGVGIDPVDFVIRDQQTGNVTEARLFDLFVKFGPQSQAFWQRGKIVLDGFDGVFAVTMENPFITTPQGRMEMAFDDQGIVTYSEDRGVFEGLLPGVGERAQLNLDLVALQIASARGNLDIGFDFGQGDLDLTANLGGAGESFEQKGGVTLETFTHYPVAGSTAVSFGTPFFSSRLESEPGPQLLEEAAHDGFLRLASQVPNQQNVVAFDQSAETVGPVISAEFDFRVLNEQPATAGGDGASFLLLPTDRYGRSGPLEEFVAEIGRIGAEPNLAGAFGLGIDTFDNDEEGFGDPNGCGGEGICSDRQANHLSLHWDGQQVGELVRLDPELEIDLLSGHWHTARVQIETGLEGALTSIMLIDGLDESEHTIFENVFIEGMNPGTLRAGFAAGTGGGASHYDLDNVLIVFDEHNLLVGDFDGNGLLDAADIDALSVALRSGENAAGFDLNSDGILDQTDHRLWVVQARGTWSGDANLDGQFNSSDLVQVFQRAEYDDAIPGNSTWSDGDWNGDAEFDSSDLVLAFHAGGFEQGPRERVAAVPEPGSATLLVASFTGWIVTGRIRRRAVRVPAT